MKFDYLKQKDNRNLIKGLFTSKFYKEDIPFETIILPLAIHSIVYIDNDQQTTTIKENTTIIKGLLLFGQFDGSYKYYTKKETTNLGFFLHPTSLYKILNQDISLLTNKIISFDEVNPVLAKKLEPIFSENKLDIANYEKEIIKFLNNLNLTKDNDVVYIEKAIDYINKKEGIVKVTDLLTIVPFSQKSLQTKFKKIVGLTPVKFIKITRLNKLLLRYRLKQDNLNELLTAFNYYDISHFNRDFKIMMNQSPKLFFDKKDHLFLDQYLK